jgi:hypothetical protein
MRYRLRIATLLNHAGGNRRLDDMTIKTAITEVEQGYRNYKVIAATIKKFAGIKSAQFQAGLVNADNVLGVFHDMRRWDADLSAIAAIPGIVQFARDVESDQGYDVVTEYNALKLTIDTLMTEIKTTFPVDGNGYLLEKKWNAQGTYDFRQFTVAQLATVVSLIDAVGASVA